MAGEDKKDSLLDAIALLDKKFGKGSVIEGTTVIDLERQRSGSLGIDIITGGGYPKGRMVEIYGPESSGKTTLFIHAMVQAQKDQPNRKVAIIDVEHAFDRQYATNLGLNMDEVIFAQPDNGEQALEITETLISSGKISVCLVDSIAALVPKSEIDGDMGDSKMGLQARLMGQACRKLTGVVSKTNTVLAFTNQLREKIGVMFGSPETTPGGNAMKFYASIRFDIRKSAGDKDADGHVINSKVRVKTVKNKTAPPFQMTEFNIIFGEGIDKLAEIILYGVQAGLIKKAGSWYSYGETKIGQGEEKVKEMLLDNPELAEELETQIRKLYGV